MRAIIKPKPKFQRFFGRLRQVGRGSFFRKYNFMGKRGKSTYPKIDMRKPKPFMPKHQLRTIQHSMWPKK